MLTERTTRAWFCCLLRHLARKQSGSIFYNPRAHTGQTNDGNTNVFSSSSSSSSSSNSNSNNKNNSYNNNNIQPSQVYSSSQKNIGRKG